MNQSTRPTPRCNHAVAVERFGLLCVHGRLFQPHEYGREKTPMIWGMCSRCSKVTRYAAPCETGECDV